VCTDTYCIRAAPLSLPSTRFRRDERTWRDRLTDFHRNWKPLISGMADAYLRWRYPSDAPGSCGTQDPPSQPPPSPSNNLVPISPTPNDVPPFPQVPETKFDGAETNGHDPPTPTEVEIPIIDIYTLSISVKVSYTEDQTTASTLAGLGFIGNAPFHPSLAVSVKTLELYRILRRRKPSFSVEAFVKVICDLYIVCLPVYLCCFPNSIEDSISSKVPTAILRHV